MDKFEAVDKFSEEIQDRLIEILTKWFWEDDTGHIVNYFTVNEAEKIADYLLENEVIVPPVKIQTKVYKIVLGKIYEYEVASYTVDADGFSFIHLAYMEGNTMYGVTHSIEEFNKQYYLTKEEAEQALKGGEQE